MIIVVGYCALIMFVSIFVYIIFLAMLVEKISKAQGEYWLQLGSPSLYNPKGLWIILKTFLFGIGCPDNIAVTYKTHLYIVRCFFILAWVLFSFLWYLMASGHFPKNL